MEKNAGFENDMKKEIAKRVEFYEKNPEYLSPRFSKVHYGLAGVLVVIGLIMTVAGVYS